ncbi:hypothetical protein PN462_09980 [Spirulina sp. CS-785/01]|uniref:hypothetical protein n=1 Tax=Spirulina sp. CS-785/01 TaxID=3021716 RepID=UPI00232CAD72|nr:hypothetical protein [Spirulina sp. CS-785/01]MDB9313425.1 hypothetical protein [Spirulina sp. CS-785/01]
MYIAIEHLSEAHLEDLYQLYQKPWWTQLLLILPRQRRDIPKMLQHSKEIVAFCEPHNNHLVAFSRLLTNYIDHTYIFDLILPATHPKQGRGRKLTTPLLQHPHLLAIEVFSLTYRSEMVKF